MARANGNHDRRYGANGQLLESAEFTCEYDSSGRRSRDSLDGQRDFVCPFRLPGQYEDRESGLYYNRHRYYDPGLGIYISPDPAELWFASSQYMYVRNALTMLDPLALAQTGILRLVDVNGANNPLWEGSRQRYNQSR